MSTGFAQACEPKAHALDPFQPEPDPVDGSLLVDPDILLKAKGFDLSIEFFYSTRAKVDGAYGKQRTASVNGYVLSQTNGDVGNTNIDLYRGNFDRFQFQKSGSSGGVVSYNNYQYSYSPSTLSYDGSVFTESFADGTKMFYQSQTSASNPAKHELIRVEDAQGNRQTFTYGTGAEVGMLKTIEVPGGNKVTFTYGASSGATSLMRSVQDWSGRIWTLQYDASRNLTTLSTPLGCTTKYGYETSGTGQSLMKTIEDPRGYITRYGYDAQDRVASMAYGDAITTYTYGGSGFSGRQSVNAAGGITTHLLDSAGTLIGTMKPEGYTVSYSYDSHFWKTREQVPSGTQLSVTYNSSRQVIASDDSLGNRTTYQYDVAGNATTIINALGNATVQVFDASRNLTARVDTLGRRMTFSLAVLDRL